MKIRQVLLEKTGPEDQWLVDRVNQINQKKTQDSENKASKETTDKRDEFKKYIRSNHVNSNELVRKFKTTGNLDEASNLAKEIIDLSVNGKKGEKIQKLFSKNIDRTGKTFVNWFKAFTPEEASNRSNKFIELLNNITENELTRLFNEKGNGFFKLYNSYVRNGLDGLSGRNNGLKDIVSRGGLFNQDQEDVNKIIKNLFKYSNDDNSDIIFFDGKKNFRPRAEIDSYLKKRGLKDKTKEIDVNEIDISNLSDKDFNLLKKKLEADKRNKN